MRGWRIVAVAVATWLLGSAGGAAAQANSARQPARKPLTLYSTEVHAELPAIEAPSLSPDGSKVAARVAAAGKQYFAILTLATDKSARISLGKTDLNWWRWVNSEWLIVGLGQTVPISGNDWYVTRAYGVKADGSKIVALNKDTVGQSGDDLLWVARDGTPRVLLASQNSIYANDPLFWPRVDEVDVSTGKARLVEPGRANLWNWVADAAGVVRMGVSSSDDGRSRRLYYRRARGEQFRIVDRAKGVRDPLEMPNLFLRDPDSALMIADDADGFSALYEYDLAKQARGRQLYAAKGFDVGSLWVDETGFAALGINVVRDAPETVWTDPAMQQMQAHIAGLVKGGQPRIVSLSRDHGTALIHVGASSAPGGYFVYRAVDTSVAVLGLSNMAMGMRRLHPVQTIRYKARDGLEIAAVLTIPANVGGKAPLIVMPHGGPFARDAEEWDWWAQFLADRGYVVVQPNYRGSSGYGTRFTAKGEGQWGLAMQDDLDDAITALSEQGVADPTRVCIVGGSYGGYAAMRATQRDGSRYRCAVAFAGVSDLNRMLRFNGNFLGAGARRDWIRLQASDLKGVSPLNFPDDFTTPILLVHGREDRVVPVSQSRLLAERLKDAGKEVTYLEQPDGDHHLTRQADRLQFLQALEAFLAEHNPS
jgi:dipeptidyl aminopeptidase/acylaminoacyl peptidase